jgi:hypothetical protein
MGVLEMLKVKEIFLSQSRHRKPLVLQHEIEKGQKYQSQDA